jgi:chloramphenicol 3-O-phosphotransferase
MDGLEGHIVILSGSPGSGKTTIAEALAHLPGNPKVHLHTDDFWGYIKTGKIDPWLPESHAQNTMVMEICAHVAGAYARNGYVVVLDGVVRPSWLPTFVGLGLPLHYVVLRVPVDEAVARCAARGGDSLTDGAVVAALHAEFADLGAYSRHVLDVTGLDRGGTLAAVREAVERGACRLEIRQTTPIG